MFLSTEYVCEFCCAMTWPICRFFFLVYVNFNLFRSRSTNWTVSFVQQFPCHWSVKILNEFTVGARNAIKLCTEQERCINLLLENVSISNEMEWKKTHVNPQKAIRLNENRHEKKKIWTQNVVRMVVPQSIRILFHLLFRLNFKT